MEDVIYAIRQGEDAMRDIAAPVCERICEYFTVCRGGLETSDEETYDEDGLVKAVRAYVDARDAEKQARALKTAAQHRLQGVNGTVDKWQVRWTEMNNQHGSLRLDVRRSRSKPPHWCPVSKTFPPLRSCRPGGVFASLSEPCRLAQKGKPMDLFSYNWFLYIAMAGVVAVAAVAWTVGKAIYEKVTRQDPPAE